MVMLLDVSVLFLFVSLFSCICFFICNQQGKLTSNHITINVSDCSPSTYIIERTLRFTVRGPVMVIPIFLCFSDTGSHVVQTCLKLDI